MIDAQQNQINLGKLYSIARNGELPPFLYYSQVYLRSLPNQLMEQQNFFFEGKWMLSGNGCFATFYTLGYGGTKQAYKSNLAVLGLPTAFKLNLCLLPRHFNTTWYSNNMNLVIKLKTQASIAIKPSNCSIHYKINCWVGCF